MAKKRMARAAMLGILIAVFGLGYICGTISVQPAAAQLPQLPGGLGGQAGQGGGILQTATQMGSSISEMEQHVTGLQKNLDTLKKIQSVLGGGK